MDNSYTKGKILKNTVISKDVYKLSIEGDFGGEPGQFYMVKSWDCGEPLLGRPLSIHDIGDGHIDFLYMVVGKGTEIFKNLKGGDSIELLGPLGNGFDIDFINKHDRVAIVTGSVGIAPMEYLSRKIEKNYDLYAGYRDEVFVTEQVKSKAEEVHIATEDGSVGYHGYVLGALDVNAYDLIVSCGPGPMLKALYNQAKDSTPVMVSMESYMGCGIGACLSCVCGEPSATPRRVCVEGPVFMAKEVF